MQITDRIKVTNEDNMILMSRYPDNYFDLAIVDPPYGIGFDGNTTVKGKSGKASTFSNKQHHKKKEWDNERPSNEYFQELKRVSKNQIIWGGNYFADLLEPKKGWIFWDKKITNSNNPNFSDGELAWTSFDCILRRFTYDWIGFGYLNNPQREKKIHPTQKPKQLYKWLFDKYSKPNFKILDTHFGSGSIAIAFDEMIQYWISQDLDVEGAELVACELDEEYFEKSVKRIKDHTSQLKLF